MNGKKKGRLEALRALNATKKTEEKPSTPVISKREIKSINEIKQNIHVAVYLMVKNEEKRICVSLDSVKDVISSVVIYDTGSTDNTIPVIREWCEKNRLPLRLKEGTFVDFSTSRNVGLAYADTFEDIDYIIMLDSNDELRSPLELMNICDEFKERPESGFLLCQEWFFGGSTTKYYNVRLIKPRHNWWYRGVIHEYINRYESADSQAREIMDSTELVKCQHIIIYQDRIADEGKSIPRYKRDKELLLAEIERKPKDSRSMFYLAQTCECLNEPDEALYYYRLRSMLDGFEEERFQAFLRCGDNAQKLGHEPHECIKWYLKAYNHTRRAEPLVKIGNIYASNGNHSAASMFYKEACMLQFPTDAILFVDRHTYDYERYHKMGISGWYAGSFLEGKLGCMKAIQTNKNPQMDISNLKFYEDKEKETVKILPKSLFMVNKLREKVNMEPTISWEDAKKWADAEYARLTK